MFTVEYWNCNGEQIEQEYKSRELFVEALETEFESIFYMDNYEVCENIPSYEYLVISVNGYYPTSEGLTIDDLLNIIR